MKIRADKNFIQNFENLCFFYGFRECKADPTINFLKINDSDYLLLKLFSKGTIIDLIHAKFEEGESPCSSEPCWEKLIRPGFDPQQDSKILKELINKLK